MNRRELLLLALLCHALVSGCSSTGTKSGLIYPTFRLSDSNIETTSCAGVDRNIRQIDAIRWSLREDGAELESDFSQMVQLSLATASAIAMIPVFTLTYDPTILILPYAASYSDADRLKQADALLIALLDRRQVVGCPPHPECAIGTKPMDTLDNLRQVRQQFENDQLKEDAAMDRVTRLLDGLCPVGRRYQADG